MSEAAGSANVATPDAWPALASAAGSLGGADLLSWIGREGTAARAADWRPRDPRASRAYLLHSLDVRVAMLGPHLRAGRRRFGVLRAKDPSLTEPENSRLASDLVIDTMMLGYGLGAPMASVQRCWPALVELFARTGHTPQDFTSCFQYYWKALLIASLGVVWNASSGDMAQVAASGPPAGTDPLFDLVARGAGPAGGGQLAWPGTYAQLWKAAGAPPGRRASLVRRFLDSCLKHMHDGAWEQDFDQAALGMGDRYTGYWSVEAAAVTKACSIEDSGYRDHPFYPRGLAGPRADEARPDRPAVLDLGPGLWRGGRVNLPPKGKAALLVGEEAVDAGPGRPGAGHGAPATARFDGNVIVLELWTLDKVARVNRGLAGEQIAVEELGAGLGAVFGINRDSFEPFTDRMVREQDWSLDWLGQVSRAATAGLAPFMRTYGTAGRAKVWSRTMPQKVADLAVAMDALADHDVLPGPEWVIAIPRRDILYVCGSGDREAVAQLDALARLHSIGAGTKALSPHALRTGASGHFAPVELNHLTDAELTEG